MVRHVPADAGQVVHDVDAVFAQVFRRADARDHQQVRRAQRSGRDDDLVPAEDLRAAVDDGLDAHRARLLGQHAPRDRVAHDGEIRPARRGQQVGEGGADSAALEDVQRNGSHTALGPRVVLVRVGPEAQGVTAVVERRRELRGPVQGLAHDRDRPVGAMGVPVEVEVTLHALVVLLNLVEGPLVVAELDPGVEVVLEAPDVVAPVDRAGASQPLAARIGDAEAGPDLSHVGPVVRVPGCSGGDDGGGQQLLGHLLGGRVDRAAFQQEHGEVGILTESRREGPAGGSRTHDDHVKCSSHKSAPFSGSDMRDALIAAQSSLRGRRRLTGRLPGIRRRRLTGSQVCPNTDTRQTARQPPRSERFRRDRQPPHRLGSGHAYLLTPLVGGGILWRTDWQSVPFGGAVPPTGHGTGPQSPVAVARAPPFISGGVRSPTDPSAVRSSVDPCQPSRRESDRACGPVTDEAEAGPRTPFLESD